MHFEWLLQPLCSILPLSPGPQKLMMPPQIELTERDWTCKLNVHIFENSQLESLYAGDLWSTNGNVCIIAVDGVMETINLDTEIESESAENDHRASL